MTDRGSVSIDCRDQAEPAGLRQMLIQQGQEQAYSRTIEMIATIKQRAAANSLNRGLSLSLPYFNDRTLQIETYDFEVIPGGRIAFAPAYVVWVARSEQEEVARDIYLSPTTRLHLLSELKALEQAFTEPGMPKPPSTISSKRHRQDRNGLLLQALGFLRLAFYNLIILPLKRDW